MVKPILILAYNRPVQLRGLVDSLRPFKPPRILIAIDGPKQNSSDVKLVDSVISECKRIDWTLDVSYRIRERNLGLRAAVTDAVSWAIKECGEIIVLEDDVRVGPDFLPFMSYALDKYRNDLSIGHISGYNAVPVKDLEFPENRYRVSNYPESYAWATWARAWILYQDDLSWAKNLGTKGLSHISGSRIGGIVWLINFSDASNGFIQTWAYRWVASLWKNNLRCISPNRNLVEYVSGATGTHTRSKPSWNELAVSRIMHLQSPSQTGQDFQADQFLLKKVYRGTWRGAVRRILESLGLRFLFWIDMRKKGKENFLLKRK